MGLEIVDAGMKRLSLDPSLLGLDHARAELPTPWGSLTLEMANGEEWVIRAPKEISVNANSNVKIKYII